MTPFFRIPGDRGKTCGLMTVPALDFIKKIYLKQNLLGTK